MIINKFNDTHIKQFDHTVRMILDHSEVVDYHLDKFINKCKYYIHQNKKKNHSVLEHNIEVVEALLKERKKI